MARIGAVLLLLQLLSLRETLATAEQQDSSLNFLILGDWGGSELPPYTTPAEVELAGVMGKKAGEVGSKFTLALGDNFYSHGVKDVNDKRFNTTFEVSVVICSYLPAAS